MSDLKNIPPKPNIRFDSPLPEMPNIKISHEDETRYAENNVKDNKKNIIIVFLLVTLAGMGWYLLLGNSSEKNASGSQVSNTQTNNEINKLKNQINAQQKQIDQQQKQLNSQNINTTNNTNTYNLTKSQAEAFLIGYFRDLDNRNYRSAWNRISYSWRSRNFGTFENYRDGYANTIGQSANATRVEYINSSCMRVYFNLYAKDNENGRIVHNSFTGYWDVILDNGRMYIDNPNVKRM